MPCADCLGVGSVIVASTVTSGPTISTILPSPLTSSSMDSSSHLDIDALSIDLPPVSGGGGGGAVFGACIICHGWQAPPQNTDSQVLIAGSEEERSRRLPSWACTCRLLAQDGGEEEQLPSVIGDNFSAPRRGARLGRAKKALALARATTTSAVDLYSSFASGGGGGGGDSRLSLVSLTQPSTTKRKRQRRRSSVGWTDLSGGLGSRSTPHWAASTSASGGGEGDNVDDNTSHSQVTTAWRGRDRTTTASAITPGSARSVRFALTAPPPSPLAMLPPPISDDYTTTAMISNNPLAQAAEVAVAGLVNALASARADLAACEARATNAELRLVDAELRATRAEQRAGVAEAKLAILIVPVGPIAVGPITVVPVGPITVGGPISTNTDATTTTTSSTTTIGGNSMIFSDLEVVQAPPPSIPPPRPQRQRMTPLLGNVSRGGDITSPEEEEKEVVEVEEGLSLLLAERRRRGGNVVVGTRRSGIRSGPIAKRGGGARAAVVVHRSVLAMVLSRTNEGL